MCIPREVFARWWHNVLSHLKELAFRSTSLSVSIPRRYKTIAAPFQTRRTWRWRQNETAWLRRRERSIVAEYSHPLCVLHQSDGPYRAAGDQVTVR